MLRKLFGEPEDMLRELFRKPTVGSDTATTAPAAATAPTPVSPTTAPAAATAPTPAPEGLAPEPKLTSYIWIGRTPVQDADGNKYTVIGKIGRGSQPDIYTVRGDDNQIRQITADELDGGGWTLVRQLSPAYMPASTEGLDYEESVRIAKESPAGKAVDEYEQILNSALHEIDQAQEGSVEMDVAKTKKQAAILKLNDLTGDPVAIQNALVTAEDSYNRYEEIDTSDSVSIDMNLVTSNPELNDLYNKMAGAEDWVYLLAYQKSQVATPTATSLPRTIAATPPVLGAPIPAGSTETTPPAPWDRPAEPTAPIPAAGTAAASEPETDATEPLIAPPAVRPVQEVRADLTQATKEKRHVETPEEQLATTQAEIQIIEDGKLTDVYGKPIRKEIADTLLNSLKHLQAELKRKISEQALTSAAAQPPLFASQDSDAAASMQPVPAEDPEHRVPEAVEDVEMPAETAPAVFTEPVAEPAQPAVAQETVDDSVNPFALATDSSFPRNEEASGPQATSK
jgi:hypothetical protein